jgi:hypothetical protein
MQGGERMVKIRKLSEKGHEEFDVPKEEAIEMFQAEQGRYFVVDSKTKKLVSEVNIEDDQELMMVPIIRGG